jgi:hypothetical protein
MKKSLALTLAVFMLTPIIALSVFGGAVEIESVNVTAPVLEQNPPNYAPVAENLNCTTYKGVAVYGSFAAIDPEGDLLSFRLIALPKKGEVIVNDSSFIYTPSNNKKGKDYFTYVALDPYGNVSEEARVDIVIEKQSSKVTYADMTGNAAHFAALKLAEDGVFVGEKVGSSYYFNPSETLTRGEFLAMCATLTELEPLDSIIRTGFADDGQMPVWVKPYVSAALMQGMISGYRTESGAAIFAPQVVISQAEAVVMLNNALGISNVKSASFFAEDGSVPAWASQAVANLSACDVIGDISMTSTNVLTRADAAKMLAQASTVLEARESGKSLLSWAF